MQLWKMRMSRIKVCTLPFHEYTKHKNEGERLLNIIKHIIQAQKMHRKKNQGHAKLSWDFTVRTKRHSRLQASLGPKANIEVAWTLSRRQWNRPGVHPNTGQNASAETIRRQTVPKPRAEPGYGEDTSAAHAANLGLQTNLCITCKEQEPLI